MGWIQRWKNYSSKISKEKSKYKTCEEENVASFIEWELEYYSRVKHLRISTSDRDHIKHIQLFHHITGKKKYLHQHFLQMIRKSV